MMLVIEGLKEWESKDMLDVKLDSAGWKEDVVSGDVGDIADSSSWLKKNHYQTGANITMDDGYGGDRLSKPLYSLCYGCEPDGMGRSPYFNIFGASVDNSYKREYHILSSVIYHFITEPKLICSVMFSSENSGQESAILNDTESLGSTEC